MNRFVILLISVFICLSCQRQTIKLDEKQIVYADNNKVFVQFKDGVSSISFRKIVKNIQRSDKQHIVVQTQDANFLYNISKNRLRLVTVQPTTNTTNQSESNEIPLILLFVCVLLLVLAAALYANKQALLQWYAERQARALLEQQQEAAKAKLEQQKNLLKF